MHHLPTLMSDLALLLIVASITTLLFKKIKQPLVIGYIVAGFLIGPVVNFIPTITDTAEITVWADIGVVFLMFGLGLEFSLHKLVKVGNTAVITAITEIICMMGLGFAAGHLMGWSTMNCIFLGGMLAMSSTTIIIKAFDDLKLRGQKFTELVFGTLVIEDIAAIFMMIILSTIAVSQGITGGELAFTLTKLMLYLALWLILSIYLLPTFLKKAQSLMSDETLLVVSLGICFGMVVLANALGFSSALGAFLAGSVLAGTIHAERVEHLVKPCKDLFGAVFFVSVGMMVDPAMLWQYMGPILLLTLVTIVGKTLSVAIGMLLSGQNLSIATHSAFSLAQIGEFSFIIATLGVSLGVTADFLYPIVVAVSVITTFTTPFFIGRADWVYQKLQKILPEKWLQALDRNSKDTESGNDESRDWSAFLKKYFTTMAVYGILVWGIGQLGTLLLWPFLGEHWPAWGAAAATLAVTLLVMSPFIRPLLYCRNRYFSALWLKKRANRPQLIVLMVLRTLVAAGLVIIPFQVVLQLPLWVLGLLGLLIIGLASRSDRLVTHYLQIEARFLSNFNERQLNQLAPEQMAEAEHKWLNEKLHVAEFICEEGCAAANQSLIELGWGKQMHVNVIKIIRGKKHLNIPPSREKVLVKDRIFMMSDELQLDNFKMLCRQKQLLTPVEGSMMTLREFIERQDDYEEEKQLLCYAVRIDKGSPMEGKSIKDSGMKQNWACYIIGLERDRYPVLHPRPNMLLSANDLIWVMGNQHMAERLVKEHMLD